MIVSHFPSATNHVISRVDDLSWSEFVGFLGAPLPATMPKDDLPLWTAASYRDGYVDEEHVELVHALSFDVDEAPVPSAEELRDLPFRSCAHSSSRATPTAPRWRLVVALNRPVNPGEYRQLWSLLANCMPFKVGRASRNPSRGWYAPREGADGYFEHFIIEGDVLDADEALAMVPPASATAALSMPMAGHDVAFVRPSDLPESLGPRLGEIADACAAACPEIGRRHELALLLAGVLSSEHPLEQVPAIVVAICQRAGFGTPEKKLEIARRTVERKLSGASVSGWPALRDAFPGVARSINPDWGVVLETPAFATPASPAAPMAAMNAQVGEKRARLSAAERARRLGAAGAGARLETGLPSVDAATRGGLLTRKFVVIGGAPGAGKTALTVALAYRWLNEGVAVGILAADEDADGLLVRLGQLAGLSRDRLEAGDESERERLAAWCEKVPLLLADGDEGATIEEVSRELRDLADGRPSAFFADSIQTCRTEKLPVNGADQRAKINAVVAALKRAAKVDGHVVIATSELARGAYRNRDQSENVNPLSAFKESGDIEYGVALALVLISRPGTSEFVDVQIVKNRLGQGKPAFLLHLDHDRANVIETSAAALAAADPLILIKETILSVVRELHPTPLSKTFIYSRIGGKKERIWKAIDELTESLQLFHDRAGLREPLPGDPGYDGRRAA